MRIVQVAISLEEIFVVTDDGRLLSARSIKGKPAWVDMSPREEEVVTREDLHEQGIASP